MDKLRDVPLFPLRTVLFPGMILPLQIFEERYKTMIGRCLDEDIPFGVVLIRRGSEVGGASEPFDVGTLARIAEVEREPDGRYRLNAVGTRRFRIEALRHDQPYLVGDVQLLDAEPDSSGEAAAARDIAETVTTLFGEYFRLSLTLAGQWQERIALPGDPAALADFAAARLVAPASLKQRILEAPTVAARLELEVAVLSEAIPMLTESVRHHHLRRWGSFAALN